MYFLKAILILLLCLGAEIVFAQCTLHVSLSKDLYAEIHLDNTTDVFVKGYVAVYDARTKRELIKILSDELTYQLPPHAANAQFVNVAYNQQDQIIYQDYNFDGKKDLAVMDGQFSCYHGPSYQVYLATGKGFEPNQAFTDLAQTNCGMFSVDEKSKLIRTATKSGCCWHESTTYEVQNDSLIPIDIWVQSVGVSGLTVDYAEYKRVQGKMDTLNYQMINFEDPIHKEVLRFAFANKKKLYVWSMESYLHYIFTDANDKIELFYSDNFTYSAVNNTLSFTSSKTTYTISDNAVLITMPNKSFTMKAADGTSKGSLSELQNLKPENVIIIE